MAKIVTLILVLAAVVVPYIYAGWSELPFDDEARSAAPGEFVNLTDGKLHYLWQGPENGEVVVMVHGVSVPNYVFVQAADALVASGYRVLLFDHFGHGFSDRPIANYDADFFDRQMIEFFDAMNLDAPVNLAALSMGGIVAAEFTARHPERVKSLALFATAGLRLVLEPEDEGTFTKTLKSPVLGNWLWRILARRIFFAPDDDPGKAEAAAASGEVLHGVPERQADYEGYLMAMRQIFRNLRLSHRDEVFRAIGVAGIPVLAVFGDADGTISIESAGVLADLIPDARIEIIEGATHHLNIHRWVEIHEMLLSFYRNNDASSNTGTPLSRESTAFDR